MDVVSSATRKATIRGDYVLQLDLKPPSV